MIIHVDKKANVNTLSCSGVVNGMPACRLRFWFLFIPKIRVADPDPVIKIRSDPV